MRQSNTPVIAGRNVVRIISPPGNGDSEEGSVPRRALDPALNAELPLDISDTVKHILKFAPVYHFIAQCMDVGLDSSHTRAKRVQPRLNRVKSCIDPIL